MVKLQRMSEIDDLRLQNKELKRLLGNALELLEKTKLALTKQAASSRRASSKSTGAGRSGSTAAAKKAPARKRSENP